MRGRWTNSPQITELAETNRFTTMLYPDPINIKSEERGEVLDCIVQFQGESEAYGWNNEAYFNHWRTPAYKLTNGQYRIFVTVTSQNGTEASKEFKLMVNCVFR